MVRQSESSLSAANLASVQYREGTDDLLVLLDADRERLATEDT
jgi:multidrug efflux system outer membrane protein